MLKNYVITVTKQLDKLGLGLLAKGPLKPLVKYKFSIPVKVLKVLVQKVS